MNPQSHVAAQLASVFGLVVPEMVLGFAACFLFVRATWRGDRHLAAATALAAVLAAGWMLTLSARPEPPDTIRPICLDRLAILFKFIALAGGAVLILVSWNEVRDDRAAEFHACLLLMIAGLCLTASANELVTLFLVLELISIPTYVLLYLQKSDAAGQEATIKYFLLSIFSSAMMLFGFSYLYGMAGTTNIPALLNGAGRAEIDKLPVMTLVALVMVVAGVGFRITAVPFHFYAPDVFQGTGTATAAVLAFLPKVAGFAVLFRVLGFVGGDGPPGLALGLQAPILFWILAAMTMFIGNVLALLQDNLKRILAYSGVAHAGYMLIGLAVAPDLYRNPVTGGLEAVVFYLVSYGAMTIGAFAVLAYVSTPERPVETVDDLAGLGQSRPGVALLMAIFLFSLIGVPATAGFLGKMFLFLGALAVPAEGLRAEHATLFRWLAVIGVVSAAIGAWYYLRMLAAMYLRTPVHPVDKPRAWPGLAALWLCAGLTIGLGVYPQPFLTAARSAVRPEPPMPNPKAEARAEAPANP